VGKSLQKESINFGKLIMIGNILVIGLAVYVGMIVIPFVFKLLVGLVLLIEVLIKEIF